MKSLYPRRRLLKRLFGVFGNLRLGFFESLFGNHERFRRQRDAVKALGRLDEGGVAALAHVIQYAFDHRQSARSSSFLGHAERLQNLSRNAPPPLPKKKRGRVFGETMAGVSAAFPKIRPDHESEYPALPP